MTDDLLAHNGHLAQVLGLHVGHFTHPDRPTGCSALRARAHRFPVHRQARENPLARALVPPVIRIGA